MVNLKYVILPAFSCKTLMSKLNKLFIRMKLLQKVFYYNDVT